MNCTCKRCSNKLIVGRDPIMIVNPDIEGSAYFLCEACSEKEYEEGNIIKCVACGNLYDQDVAPVTDEKTEFRPCPSCGMDVDEGLSKDDFDDLRFFQKFAVIVQFGNVKGNETRWKCRCENCNRIVQVSSYWLRHSDPYGHCKCTRFNKPQSK